MKCPVCSKDLDEQQINVHLDNDCKDDVEQISSKRKRTSGGHDTKQYQPLANRMRPTTLEHFYGHEDLMGENGVLRKFIQQDSAKSMILWGGPGSVKTTLARLVAQYSSSRFKELSATSHGVYDCKKIFEEATNLLALNKQRTIVFLDEIHRFTKAQQDVFLPFVEKGPIIL